MKSFLLKEKVPINKWTLVPDECYFEGEVPEDYGLAICPNNPYVILDIDKHGDKNGFDNMPLWVRKEVENTLHYGTKNNGTHYWLRYSGKKQLINKPSGLGIDLRTEKGYVRWYKDKDIRSYIHLVKDTSKELNTWLEKLFCTSNKKNK